MQRRLAVILAADVVGYSAQMERDEAGTFARIQALRRDVVDPVAARHQGRVFKTMGDGFLMEFGSVAGAVTAALELLAAQGGGADFAMRIGIATTQSCTLSKDSVDYEPNDNASD